MKAETENPASNALIAIAFVLAVVGAAFAMQGDARSDPAQSAQIINTREPDTSQCSGCAHPPFDKPYQLPKDMKPAEWIDTF